MKKAQNGKVVVKKTTVTKKSISPANDYDGVKKPIGGGEGRNLRGPGGHRVKPILGGAKNGTSLGMKSVKAGVDNNSGITRADIITAGKQNAGKAKNGVNYASAAKVVGLSSKSTKTKMKKGGSMGNCKGGGCL